MTEAIDFLLASLKFGDLFLLFGTYLDDLDRREGQKENGNEERRPVFILPPHGTGNVVAHVPKRHIVARAIHSVCHDVVMA